MDNGEGKSADDIKLQTIQANLSMSIKNSNKRNTVKNRLTTLTNGTMSDYSTTVAAPSRV